MSYPDFRDMVRFHSNPEDYVNVVLSEDEVEQRKQSIKEGLKRLRSD